MKEIRLYSVTNALTELGLEYNGQVHRAVSDAENTATIVQESMSVFWSKYFEKFEKEAKSKNK